MFLGTFHHNIDEKGRLIVPSRYRDLLAADSSYVMQGFDKNLMVITAPTFDSISSRLRQLSLTDLNARMLNRLIFSSASPVEMDKVGRMLLPQFLRQAVGLDNDVVIVGMGSFFEIWSATVWSSQAEQIQEARSDVERFLAYDLSLG